MTENTCSNNHCHGHRYPTDDEHFLESMLCLSEKREIIINPPISSKVIIQHITEVLYDIAELLAVDNIILGHIKALINFGECMESISITSLDKSKHSWSNHNAFEAGKYLLTINILSVQNITANLSNMIEQLYTDTPGNTKTSTKAADIESH